MSHPRAFRKHSDRRIVDGAWECPTRKFGYPTKAVASQEIANLIKEQHIERDLYPYKCPHCRCWHMTSKAQR